MSDYSYKRVFLGSAGLICDELIKQEVMRADTCSLSRSEGRVHKNNSNELFNAKYDAINAYIGSKENVQLIICFRSRSELCLTNSMNSIEECVDYIYKKTNKKLSIIFINSICSIRNENTQGMFYSLEKSLMSRLSQIYSCDDRIKSSIDIILHKVPRKNPELRYYVEALFNIFDLGLNPYINGSQILFNSSHINKV